MDLTFIAFLFLIGFIGSFLSGMVGIGGSIIKYPMLLYIPTMLGFVAFTAQEVSAISAIQVFFASLAGMLMFRKDGLVHTKLVLYMGVAIVIGSFAGGFGSRYLPDSFINITYAIIALLAAVLMLFPKQDQTLPTGTQQLTFNRTAAVVLAAAIGIVSGIVGAAGAFILMPVMLVVLKIPTRIAIASSLAVTFLSSIGSAAGKLIGGHMLLTPSVVMVIASLVAAPLGAAVSKRMNTKVLQWMLMALITATVVKIWLDIIF
ncbi:sulfite exporter TauE/SafE family protein [Paenibacillus harenae]|uniref:sulfite exporter TauE/SafE family protein n=1 Tax=Paenibacillus harenae TaxID=306543 RepID=UPI00278D4D84|nr:sulfite exporter TauE/SafE family protein [Paenibacillus harenae]MDQ0060860.1 putative membrane protein YfcA [Paenibacillus harenae]